VVQYAPSIAINQGRGIGIDNTNPTVTLVGGAAGSIATGGSTISSPFNWTAYNAGSSRLNTYFEYYGTVKRAESKAPNSSAVENESNSITTSKGHIQAFFTSDAPQIEIHLKGNQGCSYTVMVNGVVRCFTVSPATGDLTNGTAQAGAASTITLAAGSSATNSYWNGKWVNIISGTGAGQSKYVNSYVGSTKVATIQGTWSVNPDATSVYQITGSPIVVGASTTLFATPTDGLYYRIKLDFTSATNGGQAFREFSVEVTNNYFWGVCTATTASVLPGPSRGTVDAIFSGDSFAVGTGADTLLRNFCRYACDLLGWRYIFNGVGSTGYLNPGTTGLLNFLDRYLPPPYNPTYSTGSSWRLRLQEATGGTFTVTYGGQTTTAIAYNASNATIKAAVEALSSVGSGQCDVQGPFFVSSPVLMLRTPATPNGTLTIDGSALTGTGDTAVATAFTGDLVNNFRTDGNGAYLPVFLVMTGGHNDTTTQDASYTGPALQAQCALLWSTIQKLWPHVTIIATGSLWMGTYPAAATVANTAVATQASLTLNKIGGRVPFIDPTTPDAWVTTTTTLYTDPDGIHPSGLGHPFLGKWLAYGIYRVITGQQLPYIS
jgi:lysophospholipase L1-like esterase